MITPIAGRRRENKQEIIARRTDSEHRVIIALCENPALSLYELKVFTELNDVDLTQAVSSLEDIGLIWENESEFYFLSEDACDMCNEN